MSYAFWAVFVCVVIDRLNIKNQMMPKEKVEFQRDAK
jgi:hypothetical protein